MSQECIADEYEIHTMLDVMKDLMVSHRWRQAEELEHVLEMGMTAYICRMLDIPETSFEKCIDQKDKEIAELYGRLYTEHNHCGMSLDFAYEDGKESREIVQECNAYCFFFLEELVRHIEKNYGRITRTFRMPDFSEFEGMD